eukprot:5990263-Alexandrium_andersonii.AAC.1
MGPRGVGPGRSGLFWVLRPRWSRPLQIGAVGRVAPVPSMRNCCQRARLGCSGQGRLGPIT